MNKSDKIIIKISPYIKLLPGEDISEKKLIIASTFDKETKGVLRGLTFNEEKIILPVVAGIDVLSQTWNKDVLDYWKNIAINIFEEERELEIGLTYLNEKEIPVSTNETLSQKVKRHIKLIESGECLPINYEDYIVWRFCLKHGKVANSIEDLKLSPNKIFYYLHSKLKEVKDKFAKIQLEEKAYELYINLKKDEQNINNMIVLFDEPYKDLQLAEKVIKLKDYMSNFVNKFILLAEDKNLQMKAFIQRAINLEILTRIPNTSIIDYGDVRLGDTIDEVVTYLKSENPKNQNLFEIIKGQVIAKLAQEGEVFKIAIGKKVTTT